MVSTKIPNYLYFDEQMIFLSSIHHKYCHLDPSAPNFSESVKLLFQDISYLKKLFCPVIALDQQKRKLIADLISYAHELLEMPNMSATALTYIKNNLRKIGEESWKIN